MDTHNFYGTNSDYDDSTTDTATMRFEHDLSDSTTIRNTTRWSRIKQDYLMTAVMGGASNITQPTSGVDTWTWSRLANTKDVSNKILTNQNQPDLKVLHGIHRSRHQHWRGVDARNTNQLWRSPDYPAAG